MTKIKTEPAQGELISVIVPIYKAEKFLRRCVGSILDQTYKNLEVILVDDGSPDRSGAICDEFAKKDARVKVFHLKNGGVSRARNFAIDSSQGVYLFFLDADDWLPKRAIETLYNKVSSENADIVFGNYTVVKLLFVTQFEKRWKESAFDMSDFEAFDEFMPTNWFIGCGNLYKRSVLKENNLYLNPEMPNGEDYNFVLRYLQHCKRIATIEDSIYYWSRLPQSSASRSFHMSANVYNLINLRERIKLYETNFELPLSERIRALDQLYTGGGYYVMRFGKCDLPEEQAIEKLKETYEMYIGELEALETEETKNSEDPKARRYYELKSLCGAGKYKEAYDYIYKIESALYPPGKEKIKDIIKCFRPFSSWVVYKLGLFYHN